MTYSVDHGYLPQHFEGLDRPGPERMIIGIIGQANVPAFDATHYREQCKAVLQALQQRHPGRRLEVMSALASRSERLGAQAALALGLRLIVLLPPDMVDDASTPADSVAEYHDLLSQIPIQDFQIPAPDTHGEDAVCGAPALSALIVAECHVLLAFWDGRASRQAGDTAALIATKLRPAEHGLPESIAGPVLHLLVSADPSPWRGIATPSWLYPATASVSELWDRRRRLSAVI